MYFWNQLCSSLDIVEDTDLAINDYLEIEDVIKIGRRIFDGTVFV